ncbi:MAG TPA: bifunctional diaminohydroxyphosphoribosylaminopyrimidine deaminase/5-amino-6-(5-phosphoribosylamino)uracil reductase RibD [Vicinamibacteria bacterium]
MRRALALATLGTGTAAPNPRVGAVIARGRRVIAQGYHRRPGEPHAEALALSYVAASGASARGATLYTTLEPCCHIGRTPPCVEGIVRSGIARVVASMKDPNPRVNGGGFRALRARGVSVEIGLLREEAHRLNEAFVKHVETGLPLVTLKGAASLDGRIATRALDSKWITSSLARRHARLLRAEHEAILIGTGTALSDDPRLDRRPPSPLSKPLLRVVLDRSLRMSPRSRLAASLDRGPVLLFCGRGAPARRRRALESLGVEIEELPVRGRLQPKLDLEEALRRLGSRGITSVLVEGGGELTGSLVDLRLGDRLVLYVAPRMLGGRDARPWIGGEGVATASGAVRLRRMRSTRVGDGWLVEGSLEYK